MRSLRPIGAAAAPLLLMCLSLACKKPAPAADEGAAPKAADKSAKAKASADAEEDEDPQAAADDALGAKLDLYIRDCLNVFSHGVYDSETRYYQWVDAKSGPTGKERFVYGLFKVNGDTDKCKSAVKSAKAKKPKDAKLEDAADAYEKSIAELVPLINDAHKYYDQKDYKDDGFKKAKELHPQLTAGWDAFAKADKELGAQIDALQSGLERRELARIEKEDGKKARWHTKNTLLLGKALVREADKAYEKIDAAAFQTAAADYVAAVDAFEKWRDENKKDKNLSNCTSYFSESQDVVKKAKDLGRRLKDKKPFTTQEKNSLATASGWTVEGSPAALFHEWSEAIRMYNAIHWSR